FSEVKYHAANTDWHNIAGKARNNHEEVSTEDFVYRRFEKMGNRYAIDWDAYARMARAAAAQVPAA
ncbi:MAG: hypothetical protein K2L18_10695, partial [Acetatifactor sp.]|nr:hypothetical protein [Acetatifactor sp.]